MAGPLRNLIQGIRSRRQRRRAAWDSGWGGQYTPSSPGMRGVINPLDSQDISDRAQGVDISEAMPSTRLEAPMPAGQPFMAAQVSPASSPQAPSIQTTVAGASSPAPAQGPFRQAQCPGGVCPTRPAPMQGGLDPRQYGITLAPGETLIGVGPSPGGAPMAGGAVTSAAPQAGAATTAAPAAPAQPAYMQTFDQLLKDGGQGGYKEIARMQMEYSMELNRQANAATSVAEKHFFRKQAIEEGQRAFRTLQLAEMQEDYRANRAFAQSERKSTADALRSGTMSGLVGEADALIRSRSEISNPDDVAAEFVSAGNAGSKEPLPPKYDMRSDPEYVRVRRLGWNHRIAKQAAEENALTGNPFGTPDEQRAGLVMPWDGALQYFGQMAPDQAYREIDATFKPAYARALTERNEALPPEKRRPAAEVQSEAMHGAEDLKMQLYYHWNPPDQTPAAPAARPVATPASQSQPAPQQSPGWSWSDAWNGWSK